MAPVSVLPGRLRLECEEIKRRRDKCGVLEHRIANIAGVVSATVNFRTGRVLVHFEEAVTPRSELGKRILDLLNAPVPCGACPETAPARSGKRDTDSRFVGRHLLFDIVAHAVLPRPLDLLVPALSVLRR